MNKKIDAVLKKYDRSALRLMDILIDIQDAQGYVSDAAVDQIALSLGIAKVDVEQTASFYHFIRRRPAGKYTVYLNDSVVAGMHGRDEVAAAFEKEAGCRFGSVSDDGLIGLFDTADIGMNDQEVAALINHVVFTCLTPDRVPGIVAMMREGKSVEEMLDMYSGGAEVSATMRSMVKSNIRKVGPVIFTGFTPGSALQKALTRKPEWVIEQMKKSGLRGRGGAGFPAGLKWEFCRKAQGDTRYVICNADEGEPGTFKDRVILTEKPQPVIEGMVIAAYAIGASQGIIYLRGEYKYMKKYLESILEMYRKENLLGTAIGGNENFHFDIRIQFGAGAYVCGEESALIESAEGKRGEPRNRPPFPVQKGYLGGPTVVNNVETFCAASHIVSRDAEWYRSLGTEDSSGTKVLSISGDCGKPGIYEVEWGVSIQELIEMCEAENPKAVQVGGPSGTMISSNQFSRKICFSDLATGGSIIMIGRQRDILRIVKRFVDFFADESCGGCVPCRDGNVILQKTMDKILGGHGVEKDLEEMQTVGGVMKCSSRCGLGQTAANPVLTTIENFKEEYDKRIHTDNDYDTGFDLAAAVKESCETVGRSPQV
jgi:[NiFe] hydrogenase diaphorase moiety large subunit